MKEWHRFLGNVVAGKQSAIVACEEYVARMHSCVNDFRAVHSSQGICNILHDFDDNLRRKVDHRCLFDSTCSRKTNEQVTWSLSLGLLKMYSYKFVASLGSCSTAWLLGFCKIQYNDHSMIKMLI